MYLVSQVAAAKNMLLEDFLEMDPDRQLTAWAEFEIDWRVKALTQWEHEQERERKAKAAEQKRKHKPTRTPRGAR